MGYKKGRAGLLLVITVVVATFAAPVHGAFPGLNGKLTFYTNRDGNLEIYGMKADGSAQTRLTNNPGLDIFPAWSPDGMRIAFQSTRDHAAGEIYAMNGDGTNLTRLTNNIIGESAPEWSPDGTKLVFTSTLDQPTGEIYVMNVDGTNWTRITNNIAQDANPVWSPDGTKFAFSTTRDGNNEIYVMNADGTNQTRLTNNSANDSVPDWSPDGTKLAFSSTIDHASGEIYAMNADGSNQARLTTNTIIDGYPVWSPDGTKIAFYSRRDGNNEIYSMNADGTNPVNLTNNPFADAVPDWQPLTIPPTLLPDTAPAVTAGNSVTTNVLTNDTDTYESIDPTTLTIVSVSSGTATANPDGTITYQSVLGYSGTAQVTYRACSTANPALCNTTTLSIQVNAAPTLAATGESTLTVAFLALLTMLLSVLSLRRIVQ